MNMGRDAAGPVGAPPGGPRHHSLRCRARRRPGPSGENLSNPPEYHVWSSAITQRPHVTSIRSRVLVLGLVTLAAPSLSVRAQGSGDGFLFRVPRWRFGLVGGFAQPKAEGGRDGAQGRSANEAEAKEWVAEHLDSAATTADFRELMEDVSGRDLGNWEADWLRAERQPARFPDPAQ